MPVSELIVVKLKTKVMITGITKNRVTDTDAGSMNKAGRRNLRVPRIVPFSFLRSGPIT